MRTKGSTVPGRRVCICEKLCEVGCSGAEIEAITGTSQVMIRRLRIADRKRLVPAATNRLEETG